MKTKLSLMLCVLLSLNALKSSAQLNKNSENESVSLNELHDANNPCISAQAYQMLDEECVKNSQRYAPHNYSQKANAITPLIWPLQAGGGLTDCSFYFISAHVDQDFAATTYKDYTCGTITYDGHKGTDIAIGPFPFYKMDNNQVEVHAAAAGTIIAWHDGEFDRQCLGSGSNVLANSIVVQHADGSCALYWHMKKNSLTPKVVGQTVAAGEYLGVVGSSGSSSGPHLHFEVWSGNTSATYNDPFSGTCNSLNASTWWVSQKPYTEPAIVKASVHTTDYVAPACGTTEVSNESTSYTIPFQGAGMSPGYAKFYIFIRNETPGDVASMKILNPGGTVYSAWTATSTTAYKFSYKAYSKLLPTAQGTYTFETTYNGITCSQNFDIVNPSGIDQVNSLSNLNIYPNPSAGLKIETGNVTDATVEVYNALGDVIFKSEKIIPEIDLSTQTKGIYFLQVSTKENKSHTKIIIE
jgi:murein DD-endopeptidase MepM/ murein hydrolase activator NlpD